jgi:hypothetical protein
MGSKLDSDRLPNDIEAETPVHNVPLVTLQKYIIAISKCIFEVVEQNGDSKGLLSYINPDIYEKIRTMQASKTTPEDSKCEVVVKRAIISATSDNSCTATVILTNEGRYSCYLFTIKNFRNVWIVTDFHIV